MLAADQVTKAIVRGSIGRGERVDVLPGLDLVNTRNTGVAFGFFSGGGTIVAVVAALALAALLVFFATHLARPLVWLPTGLLLGGAAGNLIDRAREGAVTDFVDLAAVAGVQRRRRRDHDRRAGAAVRPRGAAEPWRSSSRLSTRGSAWTSSSPAAPARARPRSG